MRENRGRYVLLTQQALTLAVVGAVGVSAAGVVELRIAHPDRSPTAASGPRGAGTLVSAAPVTPTVHTVPLAQVSAEGMTGPSGKRSDDSDPRATDRAVQEIAMISPVTATSGYATVGVTWAHGTELGDDDITVKVRTKDDGAWSSWEQMHYEADHGPDPGGPEAQAAARPGTDAVVVGDVDDVQVVAATAGGDPVDDMALAVVDPGVEVAPAYQDPAVDTAALASATSTRAVLTGSKADVTPKPKIFSRSQWGADEQLRDPGSLHYGEVHAGFVHHTVNANDYSRADVPSILRGIYAYHTQSRGWSDVGYNYLVDRFGQIWEGRYGGVDRPVVGAHTLGYNDDSFAMSAIGNFDIARPSSAMVTAYAELYAWKLSLHGIGAKDTEQWVTTDWFKAINGHRDAGQTACPGRYLYERIPAIRRKAARLQRPFGARTRTADLSGRSWPDLVVRDRSTHHAMIVQTGGQLTFFKGRVAEQGWTDKDLFAAPGDLTGDGRPDLLVRDERTAQTAVLTGTGSELRHGPGPAFRVSARTGRFAGLDQLTGAGDFDDDGELDVIGRDAASHALQLFRGTGRGGFRAPTRLARDWSDYAQTTGVGDLDRDGRADVVARHGRTLLLFPGTRTGLHAPVALPGRFRAGDLIAGRGDTTGDGVPDLVVRKVSTGSTYVYPGDGHGSLSPRIGGWGRFAEARWLALGGQLLGTGKPELVGVNRESGDLRVFPNSGRHNIGRTIDTGVVLDKISALVNVGDWNSDGHGDFMSRSRSGVMWFHAGLGRNRFAAPERAGRGWDKVTLIAGVGDMTGDGYPDLVGRYDGGDARIYPSDGRHGFRSSYVAHSEVTGDRQAGVGLWDDDGAPDTVVRHGDGTLWAWSGNGPGGLLRSWQVGDGAARYDWLRGLGDVDGDDRADLVGRQRSTGKLWLLPGTRKGFGERRLIGAGFEDYDYGS